MLTLKAMAPRLNLPTGIPVWLLEGGIALVLSAYLVYQCYQPFTGALSHSLGTRAGGMIATFLLLAILLPLLWLLLTTLVLLMAGLFPPATRTVLDVLVLTLLITMLAVPLLRDILSAPQRQPTEVNLAAYSHPLETGPLNAAPPPLKLERIPLGVEVLNSGGQPLDINVLFVRLNDRGRSYCAGKALPSYSLGKNRIEAGQSMVFMSGNCQGGDVALTVWDAAGKPLYQTSAILPPDHR